MAYDDDFGNKKRKILSARPNVEISELEKLKESNPHDISKFERPYSLGKKESGNIYLLPILPFDVGPNNLFRIFKETIPIAHEPRFPTR